MYLHVHAVGTTGMHARQRRDFEYNHVCAQCRAELDPSQHVAAHVLSFWCWPLNQCCGRPSLVTTCRSCNSKHAIDEAGTCCAEDAAFLTCAPGVPVERARCWPWCVVLALRPASPQTSKVPPVRFERSAGDRTPPALPTLSPDIP